jgi:hypothetical protein
MAIYLNLMFYTVQPILTEDLQVHRVSAKFVAEILTDDQKRQCLEVCQDLLERNENDSNFMNFVIMGDETWVFEYEPETKTQFSQQENQGYL